MTSISTLRVQQSVNQSYDHWYALELAKEANEYERDNSPPDERYRYELTLEIVGGAPTGKWLVEIIDSNGNFVALY